MTSSSVARGAWWDLAVTFAARELTVRYKRSVLGVVWALAEPLMNVGVYVVVFGHFLGASGNTPNYALFSLLGVLPWLFFSSTIEQSAHTMLEHAAIIRKVAFPRELLVVAVVFSRFTTLAFGVFLALLFAGALSASGAAIAWERLWLMPVGFALLTAMTAGLSLSAAALQVLLRDVGFLIRFVLRLAFYACPIVYPLSSVPAAARPIFDLNPLVGILWFFQGFALPDVAAPPTTTLATAVVASGLCAAGGAWVFRALQPMVADRI